MKPLFIILFCFNHMVSYTQLLVMKDSVRFLALGDSYTIGQGVDEEDRWPKQLSSTLEKYGYPVDTTHIIARTGWRTDNLASGILAAQPDSNYNLVSLLIGVNNQYQGVAFDAYPKEFENLLQWAIALCAGNKTGVFILSIPDYGYTPFGSSNRNIISSEIDNYNATNKAIAQQYNVAYFDITPISREAIAKPEYIASDNLHPSAEMYAKWVELIAESIEPVTSLLNNPKNQEKLTVFTVLNKNKSQIAFHSNLPISTIALYDITGRLTAKVNAGNVITYELNTSMLKPGVYIYRIKTQQRKLTTGKLLVDTL